jgi:hypothetical protein
MRTKLIAGLAVLIFALAGAGAFVSLLPLLA